MADQTTMSEPNQQDFALEAPAGERPRYIWGVGRRKSSTARVRLTPGSGKVTVNGRELNDYFHNERDRKAIFGPLEATQFGGKIDVFVNTVGGGSTGQAEAIVMSLPDKQRRAFVLLRGRPPHHHVGGGSVPGR